MDANHFIIDGYNLMYAAGLMQPKFGPGGLERARDRLLGVIAGAAVGKMEVTVVFDSPIHSEETIAADQYDHHGVTVCFARSAEKESADELIERLIRTDPTPRKLGVVSNDHRIQKAAKRRRAKPIECDTFLTWIESIRRPQKETEEQSARVAPEDEDWLEAFEGLVDQDDLEELRGPHEDADWDKPIGE